MKKQIYLDNSATTPLDPEVRKAMLPYLDNIYGNPSSLHGFGQEARMGVDQAREKVAEFLNCQSGEIIFTSGATESNNLAILGIVKQEGHIITSKIEHPSVLEPCRKLEKEGVKVTYLPVDKEGIVRLEDFKKAITPETSLVSVMYVNNEIGAIQPVIEMGRLIKEINQKRKEKIIFHIDAVQAANYCDCRVDYLNVDLLSLSGHKIYGPKGVGVLYVRQGVRIRPLQWGGHQEEGLRSGTENTAGIAGFGTAIEKIKKNNSQEIKRLRDKLIQGVLEKIPGSTVNGSLKKRIPSNAHFSFPDTEGESLLLLLDMEGIAVSTGSACSSGSLKPSHVLLALGMRVEDSHGSLRFTLGKFTKEEDIDKVLEILPKIVERLRRMSPS